MRGDILDLIGCPNGAGGLFMIQHGQDKIVTGYRTVLEYIDTAFPGTSKDYVNQCMLKNNLFLKNHPAWPRSAVGNVSGYRCVSDCRSRGREFDPGLVPYFRGD